ncbi:drug/metabolite transporter (DMT)-like permease [Roseinatronobacter thiooxidans]|uniref:Drug/metabolite transporter (DMT)-like permease n=1 Tax=Roseinatronobacter thiooxidans TaxID=121821 RepID=A0A2W7S6E2_9RHOB|nr:DMT family transporter [Roseinatronobacter thiooxidans]PZX46102.1 drug/metabolite transporter (DMT)-like permease [Roseinatronobacter thiooxidans]
MRHIATLNARETPLAILAICAGVAFLVGNDALAKVLTDRYPPIQIVFLRNAIAVPIIAALVFGLFGPQALRSAHMGLHALRGLLMVTGAWLYFTGLMYLPLAEATALVFSAPIFITALSVPLLGEHVGWRRWSAVLLGFAGVLVIVQPGGATFQMASLLPVGTALCYAIFMISARWIGRGERLWTMMLFAMFFPMIYAAPMAAAYWQPVQPADMGLFLAIAACGSLGLALIGQAFRLAPAALVAPFDYTALIWATGLGWLIWRDIPGLSTITGAAIIVLSGGVILLREAQHKPAPHAPKPK